MSDIINIVGISGSLRQGSYNTATLHAAQELAPPDLKLSIGDISQFPLYNADVQAQGFPEAVQQLGTQIRAADGVLLVTPEYNYSVSGVMKNAIDWLSRLKDQPFAGKPVAICGASMGVLGTARAQYHLRQIGVFLDMRILNKPEVMIGQAHERFDAAGKLVHEPTRKFLGDLLVALREHARSFKR
ncbi:MAG: NAD(P)H-dependent oxidoreductase [Nevskia sp.]|nr:NAD(P)H-dependent oxidoreductase [Nevskia sp.]